MARAEVDENFDRSFGIYDLNQFLSAYNLFESDQIELELREDDCVMSSGKSSMIYRYWNQAWDLSARPPKNITLPSRDFKMTLDTNLLGRIKKVGSTLKDCSILSIISEKNSDDVKISIHDPSNSSSNKFEVALENYKKDNKNASFEFQFLIENLKVLRGDYEISISSMNISEWKDINNNLTYWIALEKDSSYSL